LEKRRKPPLYTTLARYCFRYLALRGPPTTSVTNHRGLSIVTVTAPLTGLGPLQDAPNAIAGK
jgi:hypothetical protein